MNLYRTCSSFLFSWVLACSDVKNLTADHLLKNRIPMKEERKRGRCGYNHSISLEATKVLLVIFRRTALLLYFIYDLSFCSYFLSSKMYICFSELSSNFLSVKSPNLWIILNPICLRYEFNSWGKNNLISIFWTE